MSNQEKQSAQSNKTETQKPSSKQKDELGGASVNEQINGPGKQLAKAREAMGLSQQEVADRLHLRITSVQAVEADALEPGVSVTFTKGYVRLYAKLVNMEVEPLLQAYDSMHAKENQPAKLQSFSRRVSREAHDHRWNMVSIVVVLLVLGSVVVWWIDREGYFKDSGKNISEAFDSLLSSEENDSKPAQPDTAVIVQARELKQDAEPQLTEEDVAGLDSQSSNLSLDDEIDEESEENQTLVSNAAEQAEELIDDASELASEAVDELETNLDINQTNGGREVDPSRGDIVEGVYTEEGYRVNADGTVDVTFTFKNDCWVSVKDGNGETMAVGVKTKGRVMQVSGVPPVSVILGAPTAVEIDFGGYQVDMDVYPGGESARFTLPIESE